MSAAAWMPPMSRMTVADFLTWPDDPTGAAWQLVDGELVAMAAPSQTLGRIQAQINLLIGLHLRQFRPSCSTVITPGISPRVQANWNVRIPDIAVSCTPDSATEPLLGDPVLIVEILSPSNERETRANVWALTTLPSVLEILLVRSVSIGAELFRRRDDGTWAEQPELVDEDDTVRLASIKGEFALREFYVTTSLAGPPAPP